MAKRSRPSTTSVYLYIPNIIGYLRVLLNCYGFSICFSNKKLFSILYYLSLVCDALDGWFARKFDQASTFGAVLDMLTDMWLTTLLGIITFFFPSYIFLRATLIENYYQDKHCMSSGCPCPSLQVDFTWIYFDGMPSHLMFSPHIVRPSSVFLALLALDISSHWLQMYSTFLLGKANHKDIADSTNWLFKAYYGNRMFLGCCCAACEVLVNTVRESFLHFCLLSLVLSGWGIKQLVNAIQMKTAADICVQYDMNKKQKH